MVALYRHFSESGTLLYVGISSCHLTRLQSHTKTAHWRDMISRVTVERFPDRESAAAAEVAAIQNEQPLFNVMHQRPGSKGDILQKILRAIDFDDLEETIDEHNEAVTPEWRAECLAYIIHLSSELNIDFNRQIAPRLVNSRELRRAVA